MATPLPDGQYVHFCRAVQASSGGRTRAVLMRARMLAQHGARDTLVTTYDERPHYALTRAQLRDQGLLGDEVRLVNLYEFYRTADLDGRRVLPVESSSADGLVGQDEPHPDGSVYRTTYRRAPRQRVEDFRRADGTVFLRRLTPADPDGYRYLLLDPAGHVVGRWRSLDAWVRAWLAEMAPVTGNVFVFADKAFMSTTLRGLDPDRYFWLHVMHNPHTRGSRRWDADLNPAYEDLLGHVDRLDALVALTDRQRADVATRLGRTDNLFVVPNPVVAPAEPASPSPRATRAFTVVARLDSQKRLAHALRALARVRRTEPEATLDLYGDGDQRAKLEELAGRLGLGDAVRFHGFNPSARESFWSATAMLMTSRHEGYPLTTLESMSRGCPVISYDLTYGPRDQITDGVDGILVEEGDVRAMAEAMLELVRSPDRVAAMGAAARKKAAQHDPEAFVADWREVLWTVVQQKASRTRLRWCALRVARLGVAKGAENVAGDATPVVLRAVLRVAHRRVGAPLAAATVHVDAVGVQSGAVVPVPASVTRRGRRFTVDSRFDVGSLFDSETEDIRLRLGLLWRNSAWQHDLGRVRRGGDGMRVERLPDTRSEAVTAARTVVRAWRPVVARARRRWRAARAR